MLYIIILYYIIPILFPSLPLLFSSSSSSIIPSHSFYTCRYLFMFTYIPSSQHSSSSPPTSSFIRYLSILIYTYLYSIMCSFPTISPRMFYLGLRFVRVWCVDVRCYYYIILLYYYIIIIILLYYILLYTLLLFCSSFPFFSLLFSSLTPILLIHSILVDTYIYLTIFQSSVPPHPIFCSTILIHSILVDTYIYLLIFYLVQDFNNHLILPNHPNPKRIGVSEWL